MSGGRWIGPGQAWHVEASCRSDTGRVRVVEEACAPGTVLAEVTIHPVSIERAQEATLRALAAAWGFDITLERVK